MYSDQRKEYNDIKEMIVEQLPEWFVPFDADTPLHVTFDIHCVIPKSYSTKKRMALVGKHRTKKPDLSNYIKFYEDAFNQIVWDDDAIISTIIARKIYSLTPQVQIHISKNN